MPTIRLGMGLQELGRHQPDAKPEQPSPIPAESPGAGCSRPAGLAPAAPGRRGRRPTPPGPGSRAAAGGPAGTHALDAARAAWDRAGWPRQRPVRVRGQGPGRGVGTVGEAVPCPHSSGPTGLIGTCPVLFGARGPCRNPSGPRPRTQQAVPAPVSRARETMAWDGKMATWLTLSLRSTWPASPRAGAIQGRGGGWTERTCRPTWSGSAGVIASSRTATTRSRCW